jgi:hypothetical protein
MTAYHCTRFALCHILCLVLSYQAASGRSDCRYDGVVDGTMGFSVETASALDLAEKIAGPGVVIKNASFALKACNDSSAGVYQGGSESITLDTGAVLSNGNISSLVEDAVSSSTECEGEGYKALDDLISWGGLTADATVIVIEFSCKASTVGSVFGSFEFESLGPLQATDNDDVVGIFLNGDNIATIGMEYFGEVRVVSVNGIMANDDLFVNNTVGQPLGVAPLVSGYSVPLTAEGATSEQTNVIEIAIADVFNDSVDSFLFIKEDSLQCNKRLCFESGKECTGKLPFGCCDSKEACQSKRCKPCQALRKTCERDNDCCDGSLCDDSKRCKQCTVRSDPCETNNDCCSYKCKGKTCQKASSDDVRLRPSRRMRPSRKRKRPTRKKMMY